MKKFLILGANRQVHTINRLIINLTGRKMPFDFFKWGDLVFNGAKISSMENNLDFSEYRAAFLDVPAFDIIGKESKKRTEFKIANEFDLIAKKCVQQGVAVINGTFKLGNPYYNKFTQSFLFDILEIPSIPTFHLVDNVFSKVNQILKNRAFGFPLVIKQSQGGMGMNVWRIDGEKELESFLSDRRNLSLVYQPFIENDGDYRVLVIGEKSLGIMKRIARRGEWKNNFSLGGEVRRYINPEMERFAENICQKLGMEYAGVDVLITKEGFRIIEINLFACFEGFERTYPEVDIACKIVDTMIKLSSK